MASLSLSDDEVRRLAEALAPLIAERLADRLGGDQDMAVGWLNTKQAAAYVGLTVNALHKQVRVGAIPFSQDVPGGKLYFRRAELDEWRMNGAH